MMAWTDHHFRQLLRMLTRRTLLYTEMYPVDVVLEAAAAPRDGPMRHETAAPRGKPSGEWKPSTLAERTHTALRQLLAFDPEQHPIAVQLGGRHAQRMGEAVNLTLMLTLALALALALALTLALTLNLALTLTLTLTLSRATDIRSTEVFESGSSSAGRSAARLRSPSRAAARRASLG